MHTILEFEQFHSNKVDCISSHCYDICLMVHTVWSLNAKLAVFSGKQSTERRGGLQWKENLLDFII